MTEPWPLDRSKGVAEGRSSGSAFGALVWTVATSDDKSLAFPQQVERCFAKTERVLKELGSDRRYLLSVNVLLADLGDKEAFDGLWRTWVGDDPRHWPQRACVGAVLSTGTLVEIAAVAARP